MPRKLFLATATLVLPLAVLLFAQWPLRDLLQAFSREANDLAQIIFAFYIAVAVTWASREGTHLAAGESHLQPGGGARWRRWAVLACVAPWAAFVWNSLVQFERFGETSNPGYFAIKLALWLMLVLALADACIAPFRRRADSR